MREEEEEEGYGGEEGIPGSLGKSLSSEQRQRAQANCWPSFTSAEKESQNAASWANLTWSILTTLLSLLSKALRKSWLSSNTDMSGSLWMCACVCEWCVV